MSDSFVSLNTIRWAFGALLSFFLMPAFAQAETISQTSSFSPSQIQDNINRSALLLAKTSSGLHLFKNILACRVLSFQDYMGVDEETSKILASQCSIERSHNAALIQVHASTEFEIDRIDSLKISKRKFVAQLTSENFDFDSWTEATKNLTTFFIAKSECSEKSSQENCFFAFFQRYLHETAIFFDTKNWTSSTAFVNLPDTRTWLANNSNLNSQRIFLAMDNPFVGNIFSAHRAFLFEMAIYKELLLRTQPTGFGITHQQLLAKYQIMSADLQKFETESLSAVRKYFHEHADLVLPLLSFNPQYRSTLWREYSSSADTDKNAIYNLVRILAPQLYYEFENSSAVDFIPDGQWKTRVKDYDSLIEVFAKKVLEPDLEVLTLAMKNQPLSQSALNIFASPVLGGVNIRLSSGPRPRIIIGGEGGPR